MGRPSDLRNLACPYDMHADDLDRFVCSLRSACKRHCFSAAVASTSLPRQWSQRMFDGASSEFDCTSADHARNSAGPIVATPNPLCVRARARNNATAGIQDEHCSLSAAAARLHCVLLMEPSMCVASPQPRFYSKLQGRLAVDLF